MVMSVIWKYFSILPSDKSRVECHLCKRVLSRGGVGKKASTSPLLNHMKRKHPKEYATTQKKVTLITRQFIINYLVPN